MTAETRPISPPPAWVGGPLHQFLLDIFPAHRTPFQRLDVLRIGNDIGRSYESIYQALRNGRMPVENARKMCDIARSPANVAALAELGRSPPEFKDFADFI